MIFILGQSKEQKFDALHCNIADLVARHQGSVEETYQIELLIPDLAEESFHGGVGHLAYQFFDFYLEPLIF